MVELYIFSPPFPLYPFPSFPPLPILPLEVGSFNLARGSEEKAAPAGSGTEPPAEIEFGAFKT